MRYRVSSNSGWVLSTHQNPQGVGGEGGGAFIKKSPVPMATTSLKDLWTTARDGNLSPLEQSRAWALREVYREMEVPEKKLYTKIAAKLTKAGGKKKEPPTARAVLLLFEKIDGDDDWYPGKAAGGQGRKPALSGLARNAIKRSAEAMKSKGGEPTYNLVCGSCPEAVKNPDTNKPVDKKRVYDVFRKDCFDDGADEPWTHRRRLQKRALPDMVIQERLKWHKWMEGLGYTPEWYRPQELKKCGTSKWSFACRQAK